MRLRALAVFVVVLAAASVFAQAPAGPEFRVNEVTTGSQSQSSVAADTNGNFVVAWATPDGVRYGVAAQMLDAAGQPRGAEIRVTASTASAVGFPKVAADALGAFTVVWGDSATLYPFDYNVLGRRFDAAGNPLTGEIVLNTYTTGNQIRPSVASDASGAFVVVWASPYQDGSGYGIIGQRFNAAGGRSGDEFVVNTYTTSHQFESQVAMDGSGRFVVVWDSQVQEGGTKGIFGQRFDATGARIGAEFHVNTQTFADQAFPTVAMAQGGAFMVAWIDVAAGPGLKARRFDSGGAPQGSEFVVHVSTSGVSFPSIASDATGQFTIVWTDNSLDENPPIEARRYHANGLPRGAAFRVNTSQTGVHILPAVAIDAAGNTLVTWASSHVDTTLDIFAQRFGLLEATALALDTTAGGTSDGNRVLEPGETADVRPRWRNNSAAAHNLAGVLGDLDGPPEATYTITDGVSSYGLIPAGAAQSCADCYAVFVSSPAMRPALHWDAAATEVVSPGDARASWTIHLGASFGDVTRTGTYYAFVETLLHHSVTSGCGGGNYCPASSTTRQEMAALALAAKEGVGYVPPACTTPVFTDVSPSSPFCRWIDELARRGVVGGCAPGLYCPTASVTREQMAVFVLRTLDPNLNPPACTTPVFNDVPASSPFCRWIEELARRGVVSGCGGGNYCPTANVTREQMAVFLTGTFGLTLYGP